MIRVPEASPALDLVVTPANKTLFLMNPAGVGVSSPPAGRSLNNTAWTFLGSQRGSQRGTQVSSSRSGTWAARGGEGGAHRQLRLPLPLLLRPEALLFGPLCPAPLLGVREERRGAGSTARPGAPPQRRPAAEGARPRVATDLEGLPKAAASGSALDGHDSPCLPRPTG